VEKAYAVWRAFQDQVLARAAAFLLIGFTLLALVEVVRRYLFGFSFEWQQDAVTFFILSGVFLYFAISQRHNEHLNVIVLLEILQASGPRAKQAAEIIKLIALVASFLFLLAVVWWGIPEVEDGIKYDTKTESLEFYLWPFLAALLVGFAFMAVTMAFQIWFEIQKLRGRSVPDEPGLLDRMPD
jgi:TRAP-type C4-dicarboxylate transport system permease small subunit